MDIAFLSIGQRRFPTGLEILPGESCSQLGFHCSPRILLRAYILQESLSCQATVRPYCGFADNKMVVISTRYTHSIVQEITDLADIALFGQIYVALPHRFGRGRQSATTRGKHSEEFLREKISVGIRPQSWLIAKALRR
jgi:hypothetical protein